MRLLNRYCWLLLSLVVTVGCGSNESQQADEQADLSSKVEQNSVKIICNKAAGLRAGVEHEVCVEDRDGRAILDRDMDLGAVADLIKEQAAIDSGQSKLVVSRRTQASLHWPDGVIYYFISSSFSRADRDDVQAAIDYWNSFSNSTGSRWVKRTNQRDYVFIRPYNSPYNGQAEVGRVGGRQYLSLNFTNIRRNYPNTPRGVIIHEMGHSVGFKHEHQRDDRDQYVKINLSNAQQVYIDINAFGKLYSSQYEKIGAYDVESIMHYTPYNGSKNGQPTITLRNGGLFTSGLESGLMSAQDIETLQILNDVNSGPKSCSLGSQTIASGAALTAYQQSSVPFGSSCKSEQRVCDDGRLSGSYVHLSCVVGAPQPPPGPSSQSCQFGNQTIAHGDRVTAYKDSSVAFGRNCFKQTRVCRNGKLSGSYLKANCSVEAAKSCQFGNQTVAHGAKVTAYKDSSAAFGRSCFKQTRSCNNGKLSGSFLNANCSVEAAKSCQFGNQTVAHGAKITAYKDSSVAFGRSCFKQTRSCRNGKLSGSYLKANCSVEAAKSCQFNNQTVAHGDIIVAYKDSAVSAGRSCAKQNRKCTNGKLFGSYTKGSCTVAAN